MTRISVIAPFTLLLISVFPVGGLGQNRPESGATSSPGAPNQNAEQTAHIFGIDAKLQRLHVHQAHGSRDLSSAVEELSLRQEVQEAVQASSLDVDSVLAELSNEQGELGSIRTALQSRRDRKVSRLTTAALLTGSGLGTVVSSTQFTALGSTSQNVGDALGIGSGAASTILSILAARAQKGPSGVVGGTPNMLAPLLDIAPRLNTFYPEGVLQYLRSVPAGEDPGQGTRLEQLMAAWDRAGRLSATDTVKRRLQIAALTASGDASAKVSIDDLGDRIAMLGDVRGRVSLMKRDLATLMRASMKEANDKTERAN